MKEQQEVIAFYRNMAEHYKRRCKELERAMTNDPVVMDYSGRTYADPTGEQAVRNLQ